MKISELFKQPVMLYVSSDARHFTAGHNSEPVTIADVSEYGLLIEGGPFYPWQQVLAITPAAEDPDAANYLVVSPGMRMPHPDKH